jgi:hypothetical protein
MGMAASDLASITRLQRDGYFVGGRRVVELGAQQLSANLTTTPGVIAEAGAAFGAGPAPAEFVVRSEQPVSEDAPLEQSAPFSRDLWAWLGFAYNAIDFDGSPGAIPLDLNVDAVPSDLKNRATLVTNFGTTEHTANQLNAFKVIHDLTATGGVMFHNLPSQGYLTHGLLNYNPKFFWALAAANGYKWLDAGFKQAPESYGLPVDIAAEFGKFDPAAGESGMTFRDAGMRIILQKLYDFEFMSPIDMPPDAIVTDAKLRDRYWTVLDKPRFHAVIEEIEAKRRSGL